MGSDRVVDAVLGGAASNYTILANHGDGPGAEPPDHAIGGSRGGLSTKIHQLVDGKQRPLAIALTAGQAGGSPVLNLLLADFAVAPRHHGRPGPGRPRTRPDALLGDKAYSSRANHALLRASGSRLASLNATTRSATADAAAQRAVDRPPSTPSPTRAATSWSAPSTTHKQWRGIPTRYDKLAANHRGGVVLRAITLWLRE